MLSLFQRKRPPVAAAPSPAPAVEPPKGLMRPESAASLLATPRRQKLMEHIWQRTSLSRRQFSTLYCAPLERYAELVQAFPASEAHHHAYPGGMLDHGLEIVAYSLKLRQSHLLPCPVKTGLRLHFLRAGKPRVEWLFLPRKELSTLFQPSKGHHFPKH